MEDAYKAHLFLIEEPENHLSYSNLNALIKHISERRGSRQLLITTHSSFVMNKLGVESVILFMKGKSTTLKSLPQDTQDYFLKLPGYDTLRLILARRAILVEGPSDELIVQRAFKRKHGRLPLESGVDVIAVGALAFKRFLQIAKILDTSVDVVTDNDGNLDALKTKYKDYLAERNIRIQFSADIAAPSLEQQLLSANDSAVVNSILGTTYNTDEKLLAYMKSNKTECALRFFETPVNWKVPEYIANAVA